MVVANQVLQPGDGALDSSIHEEQGKYLEQHASVHEMSENNLQRKHVIGICCVVGIDQLGVCQIALCAYGWHIAVRRKLRIYHHAVGEVEKGQ